ncbi:MAG TPA: Rrf2 family transcriptional regulator [Clostridiales bacterium]|nr:Rrf2 family transcriptional regulator [Clostridiales bacterium]
MRISAKGRYALAAAISMAENQRGNEYITVISLASRLGISKIYLEQVFSLLKRGGIVISAKGSQGGYHLARPATQITVFEILSATEGDLFESVEETVALKAPEIDRVMQQTVFAGLDQQIRLALEQCSLHDLVTAVTRQRNEQTMYYI